MSNAKRKPAEPKLYTRTKAALQNYKSFFNDEEERLAFELKYPHFVKQDEGVGSFGAVHISTAPPGFPTSVYWDGTCTFNFNDGQDIILDPCAMLGGKDKHLFAVPIDREIAKAMVQMAVAMNNRRTYFAAQMEAYT